MSTTTQIVNQLKTQRTKAQREIDKLNLAINALAALDGASTMPVRHKPTFSKAGLARIAAAQRARWRKIKAAQKK